MTPKQQKFQCPVCEFFSDSPVGWKNHLSKSHGGYSKEDLDRAGIEESAHDRIKFMSGYKDIKEVQAAAPEQESAGGTATASSIPGQASAQKPRATSKQSKEEAEKQAMQQEFDRLRPMLVRKWERRLRIPYSIWARFANDPKIQLTDEDARDGAEIHVDLMMAMGWLHAGKIEAWADLMMWHGGMILSRSDLGAQLIDSFRVPEAPPEDDPPEGWNKPGGFKQ